LIRKKLFLFGRQFKVGQRGDFFDFSLCDRHLWEDVRCQMPDVSEAFILTSDI
jgi:hypothetical protein